MNSLQPYTHFRLSRREFANKDYLVKAGMDEERRRIFKYFFDDYIKFHAANRYNSSRILIYRAHPTGMGDRFRSLVFAYWAAVVSHRVLLVDWRVPFPLETLVRTKNCATDFFYRNETDHITNAESAKISEIILTNKTDKERMPALLESKVRSIVMYMHGTPENSVMAHLAGRTLPFKVEKLSGLPNLKQDSEFQRTLLHHVLQLNPALRKDYWKACEGLGLRCGLRPKHSISKGQRIRQRLNRVDTTRPYIAVHARVGSGIGEGHLRRFTYVSRNLLIPARCLASRAVRLAFLAGSPSLPIFLATDTPRFRDLFKSVVYDMSNGRVKVIHGNWDVKHTEKIRQRRGTPSTADKVHSNEWNVMRASYIDLLILGHAEHVISIFSAFPRLAQALGDTHSLTELQPWICSEEEAWL